MKFGSASYCSGPKKIAFTYCPELDNFSLAESSKNKKLKQIASCPWFGLNNLAVVTQKFQTERTEKEEQLHNVSTGKSLLV